MMRLITVTLARMTEPLSLSSRDAILILCAFLFSATAALAQGTILQGGPWAPGHAPMYTGQGSGQAVVQDSGPAGGGATGYGLSEQLLVARGTGTPPYTGQGTGPFGTNWCDYDAPITNPTGYHFFCISPNASGGGFMAYGAGGAASQLPFQFNLNGAVYQFPFSTSGVIGPATSVIGNFALWNNTVGTLLKDSGFTTGTSGHAIPFLDGNNIYSGSQYFGSGRPWCDIRSQGAVQDGTTDDNAAWNSCNTILTALGGGIIYVPPSPNASCLKSGGVTPGQGVVVQGAGNGYGNANNITQQSTSPARLSSCGVDNTILNIANASSGFTGLDIQGLSFGTQPTVTVSATRSVISDNNINGGSIPLKYTSGGDNILVGNRISLGYGTANLFVGGGAGVHSIRNLTNQPWNGQTPAAHSITSIAAWQASTSYSTGNLATITFSGVSYYIQVLSSTGNSGLTQPTQQPYGVNIVDNNVIWRLRAPVGLYCEQFDATGVDEYNTDHSGACTGLGLTTSAAQMYLFNDYFGDNLGDGISAVSGNNLQIHGGGINSCKFTTCAEVRLKSTWSGDALVEGASIWAASIGVSVEGGTNTRIVGNSIFGATAEAINIAANVNDVAAEANSLGTDTALGTNANALVIQSGTSDYISAVGNDMHGATAGVTNGASGTHLSICNNPGDTNVICIMNLPAPSASTLGGIESYIAVSHQWINAISTAGVPSSTQPACGDLSDSGTACQQPYTAATWMPAITTTATAGTPAYTTQVGSYEKIGRQVTARFNIVLSGWTGSPTGNIALSGLPVASANTAGDVGTCHVVQYSVSGLAASNVGITGIVQINSTVISFLQNSNTGSSTITAAQAGTTPTLVGWCSYHT